MLDMLSGETLLYPIIGDPVNYAQSPVRLTSTFGVRGHNGMCIPMQVGDGDLDVVIGRPNRHIERGWSPGHDAAQIHRLRLLHH